MEQRETVTEWRRMASGLVPVRDVLRKQRRTGLTRTEEHVALARVADAAAFADLGPQAVSAPDRGRWIVSRVRQVLLDMERAAREERPLNPARRAICCWARYVDEGLTPAELHRAHPHLLPHETPTGSNIAARGRVQSLMWAGGARGDKDSLPGVLRIAGEIRTALSINLPDGTRMDAVTFGYEWQRMTTYVPRGRDVMRLMAHFAPGEPVRLAWLRDAGDCLAEPLADLCADTRALRSVLIELGDRGLLEPGRSTVTMHAAIQEHVLAQSTAAQAAQETAEVLVFLTHALRPDTHHSASWPEWNLAFPHVQHACDAAEQQQVRLDDVVYLLDRASVYLREATSDAERAIHLAKRAVTLYRGLGPDDPGLYADCLGNLALAQYAAGRIAQAIESSDAGLDHLAATMGEHSIAYAESLNVHAYLLHAAKRTEAAEKAHETALGIVRGAYTASPTPEVTGLLGEVLNDYAAVLLSGSPRRRRLDKKRASLGRELLAEASRLVRWGDHGWTQIEQNLARADRALGNVVEAAKRLEDVRDYCKANGLDPSLTLLATLQDLAEVYEELGDPRAAETLRYAHRVDNALTERSMRPPHHGRTS